MSLSVEEKARLREMIDYHRNKSLAMSTSEVRPNLDSQGRQDLWFHEDSVRLLEKFQRQTT